MSLNQPVSPPVSRRKTPIPASSSLLAPAPTWSFDDVPKPTLTFPPSQPSPRHKQANQSAASSSEASKQENVDAVAGSNIRRIASPLQLTRIRDLAPHQNVDTVELKNILGDPMIKECWNFNFLFDLDFVMQQFDEDVRDLVKVKIIHGFWRRDDERRIYLMETAEQYSNVELISAYLPDRYGTHHSKMLVLFRHDDCAQIIIHTANMISKDWTNMTQAVWRSPLLPLLTFNSMPNGPHTVGSGERFQVDLLRYLGRYEHRLRKLSEQLAIYDFSTVKAAFLSSTPSGSSRQVVSEANPTQQTSFGWLGLQEILSAVPIAAQKHSKTRPHIVLQVSSIATLGAAPTWLSHFQSMLSRTRTPRQFSNKTEPKFNVIFPTPEELRTSLDGYESGASIHTKVQSPQQQKQLQYLLPLFCHWKQPSSSISAPSTGLRKEAHRGPAAPHIKTYIRFTDETHESIDWALLTSANLSKQAWGDVADKQGKIWIQSYETGVLVWPELFGERESKVSMVPVFGKDALQTEDEIDVQPRQSETKPESDKGKAPVHNLVKKQVVVGLRMPYDLPLSSYAAKDMPWCATQEYSEPDWKGRTWKGFQPR
ncbi:phospholipase D/nuclease [Macroventuria anomochaeta]|uniref:Phospholipase D/nuclease n=1 Tax=Macroventuria anomochaeta TaxID=301207 RepID=A0ACB6RYY6_9PLEO|nr:phospholipase D/nuclease [Macroventuria anomochaeta]KAF2626472.1 phospholipase D/nuclease [Macroventuria anomochaeta]